MNVEEVVAVSLVLLLAANTIALVVIAFTVRRLGWRTNQHWSILNHVTKEFDMNIWDYKNKKIETAKQG